MKEDVTGSVAMLAMGVGTIVLTIDNVNTVGGQGISTFALPMSRG